MQLTKLERDFINFYQGGFPLENRPFKIIAQRLGSDEDQLIETVKQLKANNLLTRFGPLYNADRLGGGLTLAAISVPEDRYEAVTDLVNAYPEVAHNYRREHKLNMWFVLATETPSEISEIILSISQVTKLDVYDFPKQKEFYIGLCLNLSADGKHTTVDLPNAKNVLTTVDSGSLDAINRKLISVTQSGFSIERSPYQRVADECGTTQTDVLKRLNNMLNNGIIRRIGAVPNHYRLGLVANGMTVWDVEDDKIIELGNIIGQLDFVSHCYQRPRHLPMWRYNFFAMVHGNSKEEVNQKVIKIEKLLGTNCKAHETLFSSAILKKTGLRLAA